MEGDHTDWVEIYNYGEEPVCLQNCFISDNPENTLSFQFSAAPELCLPPHSFLVLFANESADLHPLYLPFELDSEGEYLSLYNPDGQLIHEVYFGTQYPDISYGLESGSSNWNFFNPVSPGDANPPSGLFAPLAAPNSTINSGYYTESSVNITLTHPFNWVELRYTTDGSAPGPFSNLYSADIALSVPGVFRARAFANGYLPGTELVLHLLPSPLGPISALSIVIDPDDFEGPNGINTFIYSGLEKPSHVAYLNADEQVVLNQGAGIRIHAPEYRDQQAFRISARAEYGNPEFHGPVFNNALYSDFQHLIFRCGGNDGVEIGGSSLRDPLNHELFHQLNPAYANSHYQPVEIYINGAFWGLYEMMERQDQHYIASRYFENDCHVLERSADAIETNTYNAISGNFDDFNALELFAVTQDLSEASNYEFIRSWMDIPNFVDYQLLEIYSCNKDWLSNNLKMWRPVDQSRPWQWIWWDTDWAYGTMFPADHAYPHWNALEHALSDWGGWTDEVETELLQNLVLNTNFKNYFCTRAADLHNSFLKPSNILETLDSLQAGIEPDMPRQCERWGTSYSDWLDEREDIQNFILSRNAFFLQHLQERFELGEMYPLNLQISPPGAGYIAINTIATNEEFWSGDYFANIEVELRAVAAPGYVFQNWAEFGDNENLNVTMFGTQNRTAYFTAVAEHPIPVINELSLNEDNLTGQWIEIYNPGPGLLPLHSMSIGDGNGHLMALPENVSIEPHRFFMLSAEPASLIDDSQVEPSDIAELSFALDVPMGTLYLVDDNLTILDVVNYNSDAAWPTCNDDLDYTLELKDPSYNNDSGLSWFCDTRPQGSPGEPNLLQITDVSEAASFDFQLFPNPCSNRVFVRGSSTVSTVRISLYNPLGQLVLAENLAFHSGIAELRFSSEWAEGIYAYRLDWENQSLSGKLVIQR